MANDCLVTKLKKEVDNDNLEVLGRLRIKIETGATYTRFHYDNKAEHTAVIYYEDGTVRARQSTDSFAETLPANSKFYIDIDKYNLGGGFYFSNEGGIKLIELDIDKLRYSSYDTENNYTAKKVIVGYKGVQGHIESMEDIILTSTIDTLTINNSSIEASLEYINDTFHNLLTSFSAYDVQNIKGNIKLLSGCTKLTNLVLGDSSATCKVGLKEFLDTMAPNRNNGDVMRLWLPSDWSGNDAGITSADVDISFDGTTWSWSSR